MKMVFVPPLAANAQQWVPRLRTAYPDVDFVTPVDEAQARDELKRADAAYGTLTPALLAVANQLQWLQSPMAAPPPGFYFEELIAHPANVTNFRGIYNDHISYHILGLILSFTKHLHLYRDQQNERVWRKLDGPDFNTIYPPEASVLIVGVGGIGLETARLCKAIGMRVVGVDTRRTQGHEWLDELHPAETLNSHVGAFDFVVATIPHTPETEGVFDASFFDAMKSSGIFINIGRGPTTRLDDLNAALRSKAIAGAALDVYEIEPLPAEHPLWDAPNTILTPHSAVTGAAHLDERRYEIVHANVGHFIAGEPLINLVDKASWY